MKLVALVLSLLFTLSIAQAKTVYVQGYTKKNGTYVQPHYRTSPDSTKSNNWSTKGNYNPYTGEAGTVSDDNDD